MAHTPDGFLAFHHSWEGQREILRSGNGGLHSLLEQWLEEEEEEEEEENSRIASSIAGPCSPRTSRDECAYEFQQWSSSHSRQDGDGHNKSKPRKALGRTGSDLSFGSGVITVQTSNRSSTNSDGGVPTCKDQQQCHSHRLKPHCSSGDKARAVGRPVFLRSQSNYHLRHHQNRGDFSEPPLVTSSLSSSLRNLNKYQQSTNRNRRRSAPAVSSSSSMRNLSDYPRQQMDRNRRRSAPVVPPSFLSSEMQVEISPGVFMPLRNAEETKLAILGGFYIKVQCVACESPSFCIANAKCFLCPACRSMAPLPDNNDDEVGERRGLGLGFTSQSVEAVQREDELEEARRSLHHSVSDLRPSF